MSNVVPFVSAAAPSVEAPAPLSILDALNVTLAFEHLVDLVVLFQQRRGVLPAGGDGLSAGSLAERAGIREGLQQLLNELDPSVRAAAEARCASHLSHCLPMLPFVQPDAVAVIVADSLADYRRGLRQVPLRGVGVLV